MPIPPTTEAMASVTPPLSASGPTFQNPILKENFADPFLLYAEDGFWYAYATNASGKNVQIARSKDLLSWQLLSDAMPALAKWAKPGGSLVWAPEVAKVAQNYVLYYTARDKASNRQCVGVATAAKPEGKFKDTSDKPLVCQAKEGGTIDASPFQDGNKLYLYYKNDGNCCGIPTYIYVQELAPDGLSLVGEPVRLVRNDLRWEGGVIEAPTMIKRDGKYYLFFSANNYAGVEYAVGYARCETATGPCTDAPENPILKSQLQKPPNMVIGPGHQTLIRLGDEDWLVYHAWEVVGGGRRGDRRQVWMNRLDWQDDKPVVVGPLTGPQPAPAAREP
jgi:beta-xylosidase